MSKGSPAGAKTVPLKMVGSTVFGRYPDISVEQTWNMIISDEWLVPYPGYKSISSLGGSVKGRGTFPSKIYNHLFMVIGNGLYAMSSNRTITKINTIDSFSGSVFMAENNANQLAICDKSNLYIYNYGNNNGDFQKASLDFIPGYICFHQGYFIAPDLSSGEWRISALNNGLSWPSGEFNVGEFQLKADRPQAIVPVPGHANLILVIGMIGAQPWYNVGANPFPYQPSPSYSIDYGTVNSATVAVNDGIVAWVGINERASPVIMYTDGASIKFIEIDGLNFKLSALNNPSNAYGFFFKEAGHLFYQVTFADPSDNISLAIDFSTQHVYNVSDQNLEKHLATSLSFFDNTYFFTSNSNGNVYEFNQKFTTYDDGYQVSQIPRIRVPDTLRLSDNTPFIVENITFPIEQGITDDDQIVDMCVSRDGGYTYGNYTRMELNKIGNRRNRLRFLRGGWGNEFTPQFRFYGNQRFIVSNGTMEMRQ